MDGEPNDPKNDVRNKPMNRSQHHHRRSGQSQNIAQNQSTQPSNLPLLRNSFSLAENQLENVAAASSSNAAVDDVSACALSGDPILSNTDSYHSLSRSFTANATSSISRVGNAVVRASSTGTISTSVPNVESQASSSENVDFVATTYASLPQPGSFFNSSGLTLSTIVANENSESMPPRPFRNNLDFAKLSSSPPQNQELAAHNWQDSQSCVKERLSYLHRTGIMSDIQFRVGKPPAQLVNAHKFVLSVGSAVFDALFNGRLATAETVIDIPDVEPAAFTHLMKFLYTDEVQIGPETVMTTLYAAKKYAVPALERECVEFLKHNLNPDNAFMLLTQARLFDEPQLAALCLETIDKNTAEALSADGFTDIDLNTLCAVLERDTLGIRECRLFTAVCRWAEAECLRQNFQLTSANKRQVLSRALHLIRFPLMTVEEFAMGSAQSGILEDREVVELFLFFTVNPKPSTSFLDIPRCCLTGKEQVVSRFCQIESRWGYSGTSDRIRFLVNRRIFVVGFGLYGSIHGPTEYAVNIQIIHMDSTKVLSSNDPTFQCDGSTSTFRVMFKEPVEILPNTSYIACATLKGPDSYYGSKGLRKVTHESVASGKVTFQFTYSAGNNNGTSVEDGQIPEIVFYT